jgi:predicted RNA-binding protein with PIN domain
MDILIDGYNIMWTFKNLNRIARVNFDLARDLLIKLMIAYSRYTKENIVLVFDGYRGAFPYTRQQNQDGIDIVITGNGIDADQWIKEAISGDSFKGKIVTSDRAIIEKAKSQNVPVITAGTFEKIVFEVTRQEHDILDEIRIYAQNINTVL